MFPGLIARPVRVVAVLVLLALVGAGLWAWERAGSSTPVSADRALADFREGVGAGASGAAPRPGVPAPGVYTYAQTGSERGGAGPVSISRGLPDRARYLVTPAAGGYREELDLSEQHVEGLRLRVGPDGAARAVSRRTEVTFLGIGRDDRRDLSPAPLHLPAALRAGRRWSGRYSAGDLPISFRSEVLRAEPVEVGGRRVACLVVRTVTDTGGTHPGTRVDVRWWSPRRSLSLRWTIDMRIRGPVSLDTRADLRLESLTPAT